MEITTAALVGAWVSIFLTLCIFSYLYDDNPVYKFAEHLFLGVSIGVATVQEIYSTLAPNMLNQLFVSNMDAFNALKLVPLLLVLLLFMKVGGRQVSWLARIPIAFIVAAYAGVKMTGEADGNLQRQVAESIPNTAAIYAEHGWWHWEADGAGVFSSIFLLVGLIACLLHFYFSAPHSRPMQVVSRFGVLVLMLSFGASFGYTVMGRISLAIGRMQELLGYDKSPEAVAAIQPQVATVVSLLVIVAILVVWRMRGGDDDAAPA